MKKFIQIVGILTITIVSLFACKKDEATKTKEERFSVAINVAAGDASEAAIVIGTKAELKAAMAQKEGPIYLKKVAKRNNVFIPIVGEGTGPVGPVDPTSLCRDEINAYVSAHMASWQQTANQTCRNVMVCLTCPNAGGGLYIMYVIKPTNPKCFIATAFETQFNLAVFDFGDGDLEGEAVAAHIKNN